MRTRSSFAHRHQANEEHLFTTGTHCRRTSAAVVMLLLLVVRTARSARAQRSGENTQHNLQNEFSLSAHPRKRTAIMAHRTHNDAVCDATRVRRGRLGSAATNARTSTARLKECSHNSTTRVCASSSANTHTAYQIAHVLTIRTSRSSPLARGVGENRNYVT